MVMRTGFRALPKKYLREERPRAMRAGARRVPVVESTKLVQELKGRRCGYWLVVGVAWYSYGVMCGVPGGYGVAVFFSIEVHVSRSQLLYLDLLRAAVFRSFRA